MRIKRISLEVVVFCNFSINMGNSHWIPAFAGMTGGDTQSSFRRKPESREASVNKQAAVYIFASKRNGTLYA